MTWNRAPHGAAGDPPTASLLAHETAAPADYPPALDRAITCIVESLKSGGTLYAAGNGGSAAHADHLVAELIGRFAYDRPPLRAVLLSSGGAVGSCIANDYGWDEVFARQVEALCVRRFDSDGDDALDVLVVFTTSGKSRNVVNAYARAGGPVVALTGPFGLGGAAGRPDNALHVVRSTATTTPSIQEDHQRWVHEIARRVEMEMFPR